MSNRTPSESDREKADKEKAEGRTQRHAMLFMLFIWGIIGAIGLVLILYGQLQRRRARASAEWPVVSGKIVTSEVTSHTHDDGTTYSADIEYVYTVEGIEHRSNVLVIGGHPYGAQGAVSRYPLGKTVSVSYDPGKASRAVLEAGVESFELHVWGFSMLFGSLFPATLFNFIFRRSLGKERNLLDKILILIFKIISFPLIVTKGNFWALGGMVGLAFVLGILELHPVLTIGSAIFAAFYFVIWGLWAWVHFMGWLHSLFDKS